MILWSLNFCTSWRSHKSIKSFDDSTGFFSHQETGEKCIWIKIWEKLVSDVFKIFAKNLNFLIFPENKSKSVYLNIKQHWSVKNKSTQFVWGLINFFKYRQGRGLKQFCIRKWNSNNFLSRPCHKANSCKFASCVIISI